MTDFGNVITAMITPFKEEDKASIDYPALEKVLDKLIEEKSDSIIISGTTGESPTLTHEEEVELLKFTRNYLDKQNSEIKIIFGAGSNSTQTAIQMSKLGEDNGADALLIVAPYYNKPSQQGLKKHFEMIAKETKLPIILYNVPSRTVISLDAETIIELANEYSNIIALKEASNNIDLISKIRLSLKSDRFKIYSGDDSLTLAMLAVGADGVISVASHLVGASMQEMIKSFNNGDIDKAFKIHLELFPLFDSLFIQPNPTCIKEALGIMGLCSAQLREPLVPLSGEQKKTLEKVLNNSKVNDKQTSKK